MIEILYPRLCLSCGFPGLFLCRACRDRLRFVTDTSCFYCNKKTPAGIVHDSCKRPAELDGVFSAVWYTEEARRIIHSIKYRGAWAAVPEVFWGLSPETMVHLRRLSRVVGRLCVQPIPLHTRKLRLRGFNQSALLAKMIVLLTGFMPVNVLRRKKLTEPQAGADSRVSRALNMRGAFEVTSTPPSQGILLVDDVVTTGSTAKEAARTLKKAGATQVFVWCLARD